MVYGWYTGSIRVVYGGIRVVYGWYTVVYGSIRKYTVINFSIATMAVYGGIRKYTEVYELYASLLEYCPIWGIRRYTVGIRLVYGWYTVPALKSIFYMFACSIQKKQKWDFN